MNDAGNVTKDGQQDVDEEVSTAAALEEDTKRRKDDGEDDLDDVAEKGVSTRLVCVRVPHPFWRTGIGRKERVEEWTHDPVKGMLAVLD